MPCWCNRLGVYAIKIEAMRINNSLKILIGYLLAVVLLCMLASCGSLRKLKTNVKEVVKTDSVVTQQTTVDSTGTTTKLITDSSGTELEIEFDKSDTSKGTDIEVIVYPPSKEDYLQKVQVKSSKKLKSLKLKQQNKKQEQQQQTTKLNSKTESKAQVKKETKVKQVVSDKKKSWFSWWWLLWLLLPAAIRLFKHLYPVPYANTVRKIISLFKT